LERRPEAERQRELIKDGHLIQDALKF
jgi:hypothetical protein